MCKKASTCRPHLPKCPNTSGIHFDDVPPGRQTDRQTDRQTKTCILSNCLQIYQSLCLLAYLATLFTYLPTYLPTFLPYPAVCLHVLANSAALSNSLILYTRFMSLSTYELYIIKCQHDPTSGIKHSCSFTPSRCILIIKWLLCHRKCCSQKQVPRSTNLHVYTLGPNHSVNFYFICIQSVTETNLDFIIPFMAVRGVKGI